MAESPLSPVSASGGGGGSNGGVSEVGMNVVVDLHSSASAVLNENSTASTGSTAGIFVPVDLQCPATPQLNLKLPDLSTSSSESDDETALAMALEAGDGLGVRNTSSPPPNCAICLGRCKNKCFTDSCMHQFCFKCLCEWSKVKPECPLCKQTFKSIIHNVKSIDQFEEYHVVTPPTLQFRQTVELNMLRDIETNLRFPYQADGNRRWEDIEVALNNVPRAHRLMRTARTTFYPSSSSSSASASIAGAGTAAAGTDGTVAANSAGNVQNQFVHRGELLDMYRQEYPDAVNSGGSLSGTLSQLWRRYVYDRKLYALPVCDITGRFRESSARFYRDNPAQIHRLMPWINRDIVCLLRNTEHDVSFVLERINEWLTMTNILSPLFRRRLQPILGTKTAHFIHELNNFARSPYDMIGYDRAVQYSPQNTEEIVIEFSSSSSSSAGEHTSDEEQVNVVDSGGATGSAGAIDGSTNGSGSVVSGTTSRTHRSRSRHAHGQTSASRAREYRVQSRATANTASNTPPMINLLSFTISSTSEGVEAPGVSVANVANSGRGSQSAAINLSTHNRTSDVIIDLDDTDIDNSTTPTTSTTGGVLQYAPPAAGQNSAAPLPTPTVTENIELSSTSSSDECEFVLERKPPHLRTPEMVSLNSESDSDVVFVAEEEDHKFKRQPADAGATTEDQLKCVTRTMLKKLEAAEHEQRSSEQRTKMEEPEEYNVGASTSAGLRSSGRRRRQKSIDMEKSKLRKQERRKRSLRSTKDGSYVPPADSTSSDSDDGSLAQEVAAYREKQRLKRLKKRSYETRRTTRRTAATTTTTIKSANKPECPRMIRTTRLRKRKHSTDSDDGGRACSSGRRAKARYYGDDSHSERSDNSDSSNSESNEMDTALREFSKTIKGLKRRLADSESDSEYTPSTSNNQGREHNEEEVHEQQPENCVVKYEQDEASNTMQHSSEEDNNSQHGNNNNNENEHEEENGSNFTANSLNHMQSTESSAIVEATTEPPSTLTTTTTATSVTTSAQRPQLQQQTQQQLQEIDDTISLNVQVTSPQSPRTRSSSRSLRSSIYTSSTTSSSESSTTTSSSSSSTSSDDSDGGDGNENFGGNKTKAFKVESVVEEDEEQQMQQQVVEDCYNMMDLETLDAATTEAAAALASLRNSNQQHLLSCRHPYLDNPDNQEDANGDSDDADDYENENDDM